MRSCASLALQVSLLSRLSQHLVCMSRSAWQHLVEAKLKQVVSGSETQAALRDEHAKNALELLHLLNDKLDYHHNVHAAHSSAPMPIRPKAAAGHETLGPVLDGVLPGSDAGDSPQAPMPGIDLLRVTLAVLRVQAMFRGQRLRRAEQFTETLETFRVQKQRLRSAIVLQSFTRGSLVRRRIRKQRRAAGLLSRAFCKFRFRSRLEAHLETKKSTRRAMTAEPTALAPTKLPTPKRPEVIPQDVERLRGGLRSVAAIQKRFRAKHTVITPTRPLVTCIATVSTRSTNPQQPVRERSTYRHEKETVRRGARAPTRVCLVRTVLCC